MEISIVGIDLMLKFVSL